MEKVYINGNFYLKKKPEKNPTAYKGLSCLHQLLITEEGLFFRKRNFMGDYSEKLMPISKEELDNEYLNFMEFLQKAEYIGKTGQMTKPSLGGDISFIMRKPVVLYRGEEHLVLYHGNEDFSKLMYWDSLPVSVLDYRYMENWKYSNDDPIYSDYTKLYRDLLKESFGILNKSDNEKKKRK